MYILVLSNVLFYFDDLGLCARIRNHFLNLLAADLEDCGAATSI